MSRIKRRWLGAIALVVAVTFLAAACEPGDYPEGVAPEKDPPHNVNPDIGHLNAFNDADLKGNFLWTVQNWRLWDGENSVDPRIAVTPTDNGAIDPNDDEKRPGVVFENEADDAYLNTTSNACPAGQVCAAGVEGEEFIMRCGIATCSIYLTERATRWLADVGPAAFSALGWCPAWCGRALALAGAFVTLKARQARDDSNCLRFRYVPIWPPGVVGVYNTPSDHVWCRNDWRTT